MEALLLSALLFVVALVAAVVLLSALRRARREANRAGPANTARPSGDLAFPPALRRQFLANAAGAAQGQEVRRTVTDAAAGPPALSTAGMARVESLPPRKRAVVWAEILARPE